MAGDWIKMRVDLFTHPKVVRMTSALKADRLKTVGGLLSAFCLFDVHSDDGQLASYTFEDLDSHLNWPGFSQQMHEVGWLNIEKDGLSLPNFDKHNGQSAKRRAKEADRKRDVRKTSASNADKLKTKSGPEKRREEKRREDISTKDIVGQIEKISKSKELVLHEQDQTHLSGKPDDACLILNHLNKIANTSFREVKSNLDFIRSRLKEGATVEDAKKVIEMKSGEWKGTDRAIYLRPMTLFNASKFNQYVGQLSTRTTNKVTASDDFEIDKMSDFMNSPYSESDIITNTFVDIN